MTLLYAAFVLFAILIVAFVYNTQNEASDTSMKYLHRSKTLQSSTPPPKDHKDDSETESFKTLYFKVQNLERFPDIIPFARQSLVRLLRQAVLIARLQNGPRNILDIPQYKPEKLASFMAAKRQDTFDDWSAYLSRRDAGGKPEMFSDREAARQWIKENAPLQLVDGAWVARVHNVTTPFALRNITKDAWQTYCEELGDGDLQKNHCYIYRELLGSVGFHFPDQNSEDFIHSRHELDNDRIWRASAGHLLISLFPNDFLPEILGFNLHYETLAPQTLKAAKELPEFDISGYYFAVHICIDNADSGHSAMAEATIRHYIEHVQRTGEMNVDEAWKRVQAGFLLSEYLDGDEHISKYRDAVADMIHNKASLAGQVHCSSKARIGGRQLSDWFSTPMLSENSSHAWKNDFVGALARSKPWVYAGDSERGLLLKELSWQGRMFGAFTHGEIQCLRLWIDLLDDQNSTGLEERYWSLVGCSETRGKTDWSLAQLDPAVKHPSLPTQTLYSVSYSGQQEFVPLPQLNFNKFRTESLLPLWFMHPCILEQIVMSPYRTTTWLGSHVLQILRAESGYRSESAGIAGMDEQREPGYNSSLINLGLKIAQNKGFMQPGCLEDALRTEHGFSSGAIGFAQQALGWACRPIENYAFLLGLSRAFVDLESWVSSRGDLVWKDDREALENIVNRKLFMFDKVLSEIKEQEEKLKFITGYELGRREIEKLLV